MNKMKYLKEIDFVSSNFQITFNNRQQFKSYFGASISLIILGIVASIGISLTINMFEYSNPSISLSNNYNKETVLNFSTNNYSVAFIILDITGNILKNQDQYFSMIAVSYDLVLNNQSNYEIKTKLLPLKKCTYQLIESSFAPYDKFYSNLIAPGVLNSSFCFPSSEPEFHVKNSFASNNSRFINFYVIACNNMTMNNTCKSHDDISSEINKYFVYNFFPNVYFDHTQTNPGQFQISYKPFQLSSIFYQGHIFNYKKVIYNSDFGLASTQASSSSYIQFDFSSSYLNSFESSKIPGAFAEFTITLDNQISDIYNRSYKKIPQLLAEIGGVFNVLFVFCQFMNSYIEKRLLIQEVFDNIVTPEFLKKISLFTKKDDISNSKIISIHKSLNNKFAHSNDDKVLDLKNLQNFSLNNLKGDSRSISDLKVKSAKELKIYFPGGNDDNHSILFDYSDEDIGILLNEKWRNFKSLFSICMNQNLKRKFCLAKEFYDQIFDIEFLFINVLNEQISKKIV